MKNKIFELFIEEVKKDRKLLQGLKNLAVKFQKYELSAELRGLELSEFPKAKLTDKEYKEAEQFRTVCKMTDLDISIKLAFIVLNLSKLFIEKGEGFDLQSAAKLQAKADEVFGE